jgi:hypothetical protein
MRHERRSPSLSGSTTGAFLILSTSNRHFSWHSVFSLLCTVIARFASSLYPGYSCSMLFPFSSLWRASCLPIPQLLIFLSQTIPRICSAIKWLSYNESLVMPLAAHTYSRTTSIVIEEFLARLETDDVDLVDKIRAFIKNIPPVEAPSSIRQSRMMVKSRISARS